MFWGSSRCAQSHPFTRSGIRFGRLGGNQDCLDQVEIKEWKSALGRFSKSNQDFIMESAQRLSKTARDSCLLRFRGLSNEDAEYLNRAFDESTDGDKEVLFDVSSTLQLFLR